MSCTLKCVTLKRKNFQFIIKMYPKVKKKMYTLESMKYVTTITFIS